MLPLKCEQGKINLYMDNGLHNNLTNRVKRSVQKKDFDYVLAIDGEEGCQPKDSKVLMADGTFKNIQDVTVGDSVLSPQQDGSYLFSKVLNTSSWFSKENYDVVQLNRNKKTLYTCSSNHLIPFNYRTNPRERLTPEECKLSRKERFKVLQQKKRLPSQWKIKHYEAKDYFPLSAKGVKKNSTTLTAFPIPHFHNQKNCEIEPYCLGAFLGDGCIHSKHLSITSITPEIIGYVSRYYDVIRTSGKAMTEAKDYHFSIVSELYNQLTKYNLYGCKSGNKFIPAQALLSDLDYRRKLLAGLIDTDGYYSNGSYEYTSKSKVLIENIKSLVYSIGGRTGKIRKVTKTIKSIDFKGTYWSISFYLGDSDIPVQLKYKKRDINTFYLSSNRLSIELKPSKPCEVYGFELDSPSSWYITDNWMVTHNSGKSVLAMQIARVLDPRFSLDNIVFSPDDFMKAIVNARKHSCIVFDEAFVGLSSKASLSKMNKMLVSLMMEMRERNLFVIMVMPSFFMLEKYAVLHRSRALFHVRLKGDKRGYWDYYNRSRMKQLYLKGKKYFDYLPVQRLFFGKFKETYTVNEKKYRAKKREALRSKTKPTKINVFKEQRDILFYILIHDLKKGQSATVRLCKARGLKIGQATLSEIFTQVHQSIAKSGPVAKNQP